jgi:hypothetical protein
MLSRLLCGLSLTYVLVMGSGCNSTSGGGGGGGGNTRPDLTAYQLDGSHPEMEADITALTAAYNAALVCVGDDDITFTDQQNLDGLKASYAGDAAGFPAYVTASRRLIEDGSEEICTYDLGEDPTLDALIASITADRNRGRECRGDDPVITDENSLDYLKHGYLAQILSYENMTDAAQTLARSTATLADEACSEQ